MAKLLFFFLVFLSSSCTGFDITFLYTNDVGGKILPVDLSGGDCTPINANTTSCFGGMTRVVAYSRAIRAQRSNVLFMDAHDFYFGSIYNKIFAGNASVDFFPELNYDTMGIGSSDFYEGTSYYQNILDVANVSAPGVFPFVCTNVDFTFYPAIQTKIAKQRVFTVNGTRIGVLSVVETDFLAKLGINGQYLLQQDIEESIIAAFARWDKLPITEQPDITILLSPLSLEENLVLARKMIRISVILGRDLYSTQAFLLNVTNLAERSVLVTSLRPKSRFIGDLQCSYDSAGQLISWSGMSVDLVTQNWNESMAVDVWAKANVWYTNLQAIAGQPIGISLGRLYGEQREPTVNPTMGCRYYECSMGTFVTDAMRAHAKTDIAIFNSGAIRGSISAGNVTTLNILAVFPFGDTISVLEISGLNIIAVLEHSVERAWNETLSSSGRFLQISGLKFSWNPIPDLPLPLKAERILDVFVLEGNAWTPIDLTRQYTVAMTGYLSSGGDGYGLFIDSLISRPVIIGGANIVGLMQDKLTNSTPPGYSPFTEGRITRATSKRERVIVAGLFYPSLGPAYQERVALANVAIQHINNHSDGFFDEILTGGDLIFMNSSSSGDETLAAQLSFDFFSLPVQGIIGPELAAEVAGVVLNSKVFQRPLVTYSIADDSYSDSSLYLLRTSATNRAQGKALAQLCDAMNWTRVTLVWFQDGDIDRQQILNSFTTTFEALGSQIVQSPFQYANGSFNSTQILEVITNGFLKEQKVLVFIADVIQARQFFLYLTQLQASTNDIWIGNDAWVTPDLLTPFTPSQKTSVSQLLSGSVGLRQYQGEDSLIYNQILTQWQTLDPILYPSADPNRATFDEHSPFAYAILALAKAFDDVIKQHGDPKEGNQVVAAMKNNPPFQGMTGQVQFDTQGNRVAMFSVMNFQNFTNNGTIQTDWQRAGTLSIAGSIIVTATIVFPGGSTFPPTDGTAILEIYQGNDCTGAVYPISASESLCNVNYPQLVFSNNTTDLVHNNFISFRIRNGYSATFARGCAGQSGIKRIANTGLFSACYSVQETNLLSQLSRIDYAIVEPIVPKIGASTARRIIGILALFITLLTCIACAALIIIRHSKYPISVVSWPLLLVATFGTLMMSITPISAISPENIPCGLLYYMYTLAPVVFGTAVTVLVHRQNYFYQWNKHRVRLFHSTDPEAVAGLRLMKIRLSSRRMLMYCCGAIIPALIIVILMGTLGSDQYDYNSGEGCHISTRITYFQFACLIIYGGAIAFGLYVIRDQREFSGFRGDIFYLLCGGVLFGFLIIVLSWSVNPSPQTKDDMAYLLWAIPMLYEIRIFLMALRTLAFVAMASAPQGPMDEPLQDLLSTQRGYGWFLAYACGEFNEENPLCWKAIETFKKRTSYNALSEICTKYFHFGAPFEVNLSATTKGEVVHFHESLSPDATLESMQSCLDMAQYELIGLMSGDCYIRFQASSMWAAYKRGDPAPAQPIEFETTQTSPKLEKKGVLSLATGSLRWDPSRDRADTRPGSPSNYSPPAEWSKKSPEGVEMILIGEKDSKSTGQSYDPSKDDDDTMLIARLKARVTQLETENERLLDVRRLQQLVPPKEVQDQGADHPKSEKNKRKSAKAKAKAKDRDKRDDEPPKPTPLDDFSHDAGLDGSQQSSEAYVT